MMASTARPARAGSRPWTQRITPGSVIRTYGRYAPFYDFLFGAIQRPGCLEMTEAVRAIGANRILEIGVGTGLTLPLYPEAAQLTGIDLSADMLDHARNRATGLAGRDIRLAMMDGEHLEFTDHSFDCVTVPYVLSVTPNPERLISEMRRVCMLGGHILIVNHFTGSRFWHPLERLLRSVADRVGFRSDFSYADNVLKYDWTVLSAKPLNLFGLYRLIVIRND